MVGIIGGGISGLSLAFFLSKKGRRVTVFEKGGQLGGNAGWIDLGGYPVGKFYHVISSRDICFIDLAAELGLANRLRETQTKMGFFGKGRIYSLSSLGEFLKFPYLTFVDRLKLGWTILSAQRLESWRDIEGMTSREWLIKNGGERNYNYLWGPLMKARFGRNSERLSAVDMWFRIRRMSALRRSDFKESACCLDGGLKVLWQAMEERLVCAGVVIHKSCSVSRIRVDAGNKCTGVEANGREFDLDSVICTTPLPETARLLPSGCGEYKDSLGRIGYLANICLILQLKKPLAPFYQLNLADEDIPFTGVIGAGNIYPPEQFGGSYIFYVSKYLSRDEEFFAKPENQIIEDYAPYLERICPEFERDWIIAYKVTREPEVEPLHVVNYSKHKPSFETPIKNLRLLCSAQIYPEPTVLNEAVRYAREFAETYYSEI